MSVAARFAYAGALMAGGHSTRMGRDKASLWWQNEPLWRYQCQTLLAAGVESLCISCRESQALTFGDAWPLVLDQSHQSGPLSAIGNVLNRTKIPTLVLGVDMPYVTGEFLRGLIEASEGGQKSVVFEHEGYFEPLVAFYSPSALPEIQRLEEAGQRRLQALWRALRLQNLAKVLIPESGWRSCFENLNTLEQWNQHVNPSPQ